MTGETYKTINVNGKKVNCIDEVTGFSLNIEEQLYYIDYDENELGIEQIIDGEKEYFGTVPMSELPEGDCIEERAAKFILAANIENKIQEYGERQIVSLAFEGLYPGFKHGWAVYNPDTDEFLSLSLGTGEWIQNDKRIYLFTVDQNVYSNTAYNDCGDILSEEEYADMKAMGIENVAEYLQEYTSDTFESRFEEMYQCYAEIDWDSIREQINDYFNSPARA
jgi:hypothetical protein